MFNPNKLHFNFIVELFSKGEIDPNCSKSNLKFRLLMFFFTHVMKRKRFCYVFRTVTLILTKLAPNSIPSKYPNTST